MVLAMTSARALLVSLASLLALPALSVAPDQPTVLIGVLTRQGVESCDPVTHKSVWSDLHWEVGWVRLDVDALALDTLDELEGEAVVVKGKVVTATPPSPTNMGGSRCEMEQMRSDWVRGPTGVRMWSGAATTFSRLKATSVEQLSIVGAVEKGALKVTWKHPKGVDPADLAFSMHYEGCFGKPNSHDSDAWKGRSDAKHALSRVFPLHYGDRSKGKHERSSYGASTLRVRSTTAPVQVDLDLSIRKLGVKTWPCDE